MLKVSFDVKNGNSNKYLIIYTNINSNLSEFHLAFFIKRYIEMQMPFSKVCMFALCNRQHTVPSMPDYSYRALPTSSSSSSSATILSQTTLNILQCNFSAEPLLILFLVRETGTSTGCFCSISNKLRFILVFSFITNAKMQNGKPAIISETQDGMVWYGMV